MVQSVLSTILDLLHFIVYLFRVQIGITNKIEKLMREFMLGRYWGGRQDHLFSCDVDSLPKCAGHVVE